jgi:hypothetical protein
MPVEASSVTVGHCYAGTDGQQFSYGARQWPRISRRWVGAGPGRPGMKRLRWRSFGTG